MVIFNSKKKDVDKYFNPINYVRTLPDFVIVSKDGRVNFLEVKYRYNGELFPKDTEVFDTFPDTLLLTINTKVTDKILDEESTKKLTQKDIEEIKQSRFHLRFKIFEDDEKVRKIGCLTLSHFLKLEFDISKDGILKQYGEYVTKWIPDARE